MVTAWREWSRKDGAGLFLLLPLCVALQSLPATWRAALLLQRDAFYDGAWWQLLSAHFVHLSWPHLGFNMLGLVVLQQLFGLQLSAWRGWIGMVLIAAATGIGLLALSPGVRWYGGFSGVLTGLFVYAAATSLRQRTVLAGTVLAIIAAKIVTEQWRGAAIDHSGISSIPVVVDAHLFGALAGAAYAAVLPACKHRLTR